VIDIGANSGQWSSLIRSYGYIGTIFSFEPGLQFENLKKKVEKDVNWHCENVAISNFVGSTKLNVASNGGLSSSILEPTGILGQGFDLHFSNKIQVPVTTLDNYFNDLSISNGYLKLDVQGAEKNILEASERTLQNCVAVEFESALIELYGGERNHYELAELLLKKGFEPYQVVPTHWDKNLRTISLDSIFVRQNLGMD
jgi:FkbM family methyltransferase